MATPSRLDDKELLYRLVKQAKSSHSNLGRSMDVDLSYRRIGGATVEPGVLSTNRLDRERQREAQAVLQEAWGGSGDGGLSISPLGTVVPSFTQAADDGTVALGGTARVGPGFTTLVGAVPTESTIRCIEDNTELISSFRPYAYDARRAEREESARHRAAPHPDLLRQLAPVLASVSPSRLVDVGALPYPPPSPSSPLPQPPDDDVEESEAPPPQEARSTKVHSAPPGGTYSFRALGRPTERPRLPGHRAPVLGQYQLRYQEVEPRVTHGYMTPAPTTQPRRLPAPAEETGPVERRVSARTDVESLMGATHAFGLTDGNGGQAETYTPGGNVKGSSMFLSKTERGQTTGTAAPDVMYWPYPDIRSTTSRQPTYVQMDVPTTTRRRQPHVSGRPAGSYEVAGDISKGLRNPVQMRSTTGRDQHYYGKREQYASNADWLDVDEALRATRPNERAAVLPPPQSQDAPRRHSSQIDTSTSVERNLNYPADGIGGANGGHHVRRFDQVLSREQREAAKNLNRYHTPSTDDYDVNRDYIEKRSTAAIIHPRAPGHGALHDPNPTELSGTPNYKWVKPSSERGTQFGTSSKRPDHLLPMHDLSYDVQRGYQAVEPRVRGDPHIATMESRQSRAKRAATDGNGANVMYDLSGYPPRRNKLVPDFEKQITKETEFRGHRIQSERWERENPKAPGPGYYNVSYRSVDPDPTEPRINTIGYR